MHKVTLKKRDPIFIADADGILIKAKWEDKKVSNDFKFTVNGVTFSKGSIEYIDLLKERKEQNRAVEDTNRVDRDMYNEWRSKTPEEKASRLTPFVECFKVVHGSEPKPELIDMLKSSLVTFFSQNPNRTYADYLIYRKFLLKQGQAVTVLGARMIGYFMAAISNDYQNAKYSK